MDKLLNFLNEKLLPFLVTTLLIFIPLYPKLPLVGVSHTWVYIRLEDFLVAAAVGIWALLLVRKKITLPKIISLPIFLYWLVGLVSTAFAIVFIFPQLANVFPNVAIFNYLRRIEYLVLLPVAFSTIKKKEDSYKYIMAMGIAVIGVILYGLGQKFIGFPAFLTMNEEFAKGIPLYLPAGARITSTFGGHYDLAAYLVITIALLSSLVFGVRNLFGKLILLTLWFGSLVVLLLTASRVSFAVYLLTISFMLVLQKKKWLIIPVVLISLVFLLQVSGTAERFSKTIRVQQVVYNTQTGQPIAVLEKLPPEISGIKPTPTPGEALPVGTAFIALPPFSSVAPEATSVAVIRKPVSTTLKLATMSSELSTISGSFLIQKALVYDISFTTRFQGQWPRAWNAFLANPILGTGYSSISLATDGDYFRLLGETGILGFLSFLFIFVAYFILVKKRINDVDSPLSRSFVLGVTAATFGVFVNAILIDVFEASKVAFVLWLLLGISVGLLSLSDKEPISLWKETKKIVLSDPAIVIYLLLFLFLAYGKSINYYFVGPDFNLLRLAAVAKLSDIVLYFTSLPSLFNHPLPNLLYFGIYTFFWLKPLGYHLVSLGSYFLLSVLIYFWARGLFKNRLKAFLTSILFLFLPTSVSTVIGVSNYSQLLTALFVVLGVTGLMNYVKNKYWYNLLLVVLSVLLFLMSFEHKVPTLMISIVVFMVLIYFFNKALVKFTHKNSSFEKLIMIMVFLITLGLFKIQSDRASSSWEKAGETTRSIIYAVKDNYRSFPKNSTLYFVNVPERIESAWVFPKGLTSAMWFVYRDKTLKIKTMTDLSKTLDLADKKPGSYVFNFEKGELKEVTLK